MRWSAPMAGSTWRASAPTSSHRFAISFAKLIFVARNALAAYLIISAEVSWVEISSGRRLRRPPEKVCSSTGR